MIHTDFERGFIKAEVISFEDLLAAGSVAAARTAGKARMEGKDYVMRDGDVVEFRFNTWGGARRPAPRGQGFGFWFGLCTENDAVTCLPSGLITYQRPPSWSMACPVTMPGVTSRLYV